jgi:hypothetical protein
LFSLAFGTVATVWSFRTVAKKVAELKIMNKYIDEFTSRLMKDKYT